MFQILIGNNVFRTILHALGCQGVRGSTRANTGSRTAASSGGRAARQRAGRVDVQGCDPVQESRGGGEGGRGRRGVGLKCTVAVRSAGKQYGGAGGRTDKVLFVNQLDLNDAVRKRVPGEVG